MYLLDMLPGIIGAGILGLYIGNFATNPIFRLPRNEPIFIKDPYCDHCNTRLVRRDLYPVLSWVIARGKCRYCSAPVPAAYTITETLIGLLFVICYMEYGFSENFILLSLGMTSLVMLAVMLIHDSFFSDKTLLAGIIFGMVLRTLEEGSIYGFAGGAFTGLLAGAAIWKISGTAMVRDVKSFPSYLKLLVAAGIWLPLPQLVILMVITGLLFPLQKRRIVATELTIIFGIMALTLIRTLY